MFTKFVSRDAIDSEVVTKLDVIVDTATKAKPAVD